MSERFLCPVGVFLLIFDDGKLVMQYRKNCSFDGMYGLVGGHIDGGEKITSAIVREAKEEIGIDISEKDITLATICHSNAGGKEYMQFYFRCDKYSGEIVNNELDKCDHIKSFAIEKLPENTVPYIKEAIEKIKHNITFYESGF